MKQESRIVKSLLSILLVFALVSCGTGVVTVNAQQTHAPDANARGSDEEAKWKTIGLRQANTMGGGPAPIPGTGKLRVFVLMGQSNMHGTARARELRPPYTEKHDRIRIWANGRWEYFVPTQRFGPGVSFAHQLAEVWPNDTIGIIKVSSGGTGIRAFEKNWSFDRAHLTFDGKKGSLYKDLMHAVAEAKRISDPEFCGAKFLRVKVPPLQPGRGSEQGALPFPGRGRPKRLRVETRAETQPEG